MMTAFKRKVVHYDQRGFTLAELLIAIAITALIGAAVATAVFQVFRINASSTNRQIAINQVEVAINSISRDAQQAQQISPATGVPFTMQWTTWDNHTNVVIYSLSGTNLQRTITIDSGSPSTTIVANYITVASGTWNTSTKVLNLTLRVTVGTGSSPQYEERTFQINPRSAQ
jgi:prepilin-type N-terminal cleavage/methylation domain-containing protein